MSNTILSINMNMPVPIVGTEPGPDWASDLNACLSILDIHDHSAGYGIPITPAGLNISSDLSMVNHNLTLSRSVRFQTQSAVLSLPTDLGAVYVTGVDLYFNDGLGNQIRLTQSGGVAGTPGSIASLASPASATYVSGTQTFVWQSAANTPANMDIGGVILRNVSASSFGLTILPPTAMGANYTLNLPSLPASQKFMTLDASGNISAPWAVDGSTLVIASNVLKVPSGGITTTEIATGTILAADIANGTITTTQIASATILAANIANATITTLQIASATILTGNIANSTILGANIASTTIDGTKLTAPGAQVSASSGGASTTSATFIDVVSVTITTIGRPVLLLLQGDGTTTGSNICGGAGSNGMGRFFRGSTEVAQFSIPDVSGFAGGLGSLAALDTVAAGTYTYKVQFKLITGSAPVFIRQMVLVAFEL